MSFGDLYQVPAGADVAPGLPPVDLPKVEGATPRTRIEVTVPRKAAKDDPLSAGFTPYQEPTKAAEPAPSTADMKPEDAGFQPYQEPQPTPQDRQIGVSEAIGKGVMHALTLGTGPAIAGLSSVGGMARPPEEIEADPQGPTVGDIASPIIGAWHKIHSWLSAHPNPQVQADYQRGQKAALEGNALAQEQQSPAYMGGLLLGSLMLPGMGAGTGAASAVGRIAAGTGRGIAGGAAFGAGEAIGRGESLPDVLTEAGKGGGAGAIFGTAGAGAAEGLGAIGSKVASLVRGQTNPDTEAARRVVTHVTEDLRNRLPMGAEEISAANAAQVPRSILDAGESTRALMRSAVNTSPTARERITQFVSDRFATQGQRISGLLRRLTGGGDAGGDLEAIQTAARAVNRPAYARAYRAGDRPIWSPELERLTGSDELKTALGGAAQKWKSWQVADGFGASNPPVRVTPDGRFIKTGGQGMPTYPNIQFWDYAARELADKAQAARRAGNAQEAARVGSIERQLKSELDRLVPEFGAARQGAARFFGAENALEAGQNFVMRDMRPEDAVRALHQMSPGEREIFARGFATELINRIADTRNRVDVVNNIFGSDTAIRKMQIALGADRARQVEALLRVESIVDRARTALGNSTTVRQATEAGLAGAGAVGSLELVREHDADWKHVLVGALVFGSARHGAQVIDRRVAERVGDMLLSRDPAILQRGLQAVAHNPVMLNALRRFMSAGANVASDQLGLPGAAAAASTALGASDFIGGHQAHEKDDPAYLQ